MKINLAPGRSRWISCFALMVFSLLLIERSVSNQLALVLVESAKTEDLFTALAFNQQSPEVHFRLGELFLYNLVKPEPVRALEEFTIAARLSPYSYRIWMELGKANEEAGKFAAARAAFEHSIGLAPNSFDPQWASANFLLRHDSTASALPSFRRAIEKSPEALATAMDLISRVRPESFPQLAQIVPDNIQSKLQYAAFLAKQQKSDDAISVVEQLPVEAFNQQHTSSINEILIWLYKEKRYTEAKRIWLRFVKANAPVFNSSDIEAVFNGSFEYETQFKYFDWTIGETSGVEIVQTEKGAENDHGGLKIVFKNQNSDLILPMQVIPVTAGKQYRLTFFKQSENLIGENPPFVELYDLNNSERLHLKSTPLSGNETWKADELNFQTLADTRAIVLRIRRQQDIKNQFPIKGIAQFDNFILTMK